MQDRTDGFKTHHRIAAAKELIVHIVRDEQPSHAPSPSTRETDKRGDSDTPSPSTGEGGARPESPRRSEGDSPVVPAQAEGNPDNTIVVPAKAGTQGRGVARPSKAGVHPEPNSPVVPAPTTVVPAEAGTQGGGGGRNTAANSPVVPAPTTVVPAEAGTQGGGGGRNTLANSPVVPAPTTVVPANAGTHPRDPELGSQLETKNSKLKTLPTRRDGAPRAAIRRKALGSERIEEEKDEKPAPAELTIAERRIKEKLKQHWHEPDPWTGPIDSTHPGRSPP